MGIRSNRSAKHRKKIYKRRAIGILTVVFAVAAMYFSGGNAWTFLKIFFGELIFLMALIFLSSYLKDKDKKSEGMDRDFDSFSKTFDQERDTSGHGKSSRLRAVGGNFNWVVDGPQEEKRKGNREIEVIRKNVEKSSSQERDIKAEVQNWAKAVNFSQDVYGRILQKTSASMLLKENQEEENGVEASEISDTEVTPEGINEIPAAYEQGFLDMVSEVEDPMIEQACTIDLKMPCYDLSGEAHFEEDETLENPEGDGKYEDHDTMEEASCVEGVEAQPMAGMDLPNVNVSGNGNKETCKLYIIKDKNKLNLKVLKDPQAIVKGATEDTKSPVNIKAVTAPVKRVYANVVPPVELLKKHEFKSQAVHLGSESERNGIKLIETLASFGVGAKIINISEGPSVTRYEIQPDYGVKVSKIVGLTDDIALNLAATGVRIEAPIPGKAAIGIEIPNREVTPVLLRDVVESKEFLNHPSKVAFAVGKDIAGNTVVADIATMPHLLIAGATGAGKSVCINTMITSILYKASPSEVKLLMVDPKVVELSIYNGIPHLLIPVVTDPKKAAGALNWAVQEMASRYKLFADNNVRDLKGYNSLMREKREDPLPQIVIIIDELADLMMVAPNDVEDCICRLAQMARAAGMHLVIATQRPSVDVITGVIKANIPSRIAFAVSSQIDSRTILDMAGAEKLLGRGDMLFNPLGKPKPVRVQGALITDKEVETIVSFIKSKEPAQYDENVIEKIDSHTDAPQIDSENDDELLPQVVDMVIEQGQASTSLIQRKFKIGYSRAARILDQLESSGIVGPFEGSKPRKVLLTRQEWLEMN